MRSGHVPETIEPPPSTVLSSIGQSSSLIEVHQQMSVRKSFEPDVDQCLLDRERRHVRAPTLSPITYRRYVDTIEIWISVIALPGSRYEFSPIFQIERIAEIGLPDAPIFVCRFVGATRTRVAIPGGQWLYGPLNSGVWHEPNGKLLMVLSCFLQRQINNVPTKISTLRLDGVPVPAKIGDGGIGKVGLSRSLLQLRDRAAFRPLIRGIERLAVESLKGCDTHPGIYENILNLHRPDHDSIVLRISVKPIRQNQKCAKVITTIPATNHTQPRI